MSKQSGFPLLTMNKFFVSKRASIFEVQEETSREKRERSPCGAVEASQRKLEARQEKEKKKVMAARRKRQADPYAEESSAPEEENVLPEIESKLCHHVNHAVNFSLVKKALKQGQPFGKCMQCRKNRLRFNAVPQMEESNVSMPIIWLCAFCGHQGCDRNSEKHALLHYRTPRSDRHCLIVNIHTWTVWCYECDSEVVPTSSKKLHELLQHVRRLSEVVSHSAILPKAADSEHPHEAAVTERGICTKAVRSQKISQNNAAVVPRVKGLSNLGNTCFFNSVLQNLAQTPVLNLMFDEHMQSGLRVNLPGCQKLQDGEKSTGESSKDSAKSNKQSRGSDNEEEEELELKPLDLFLPEGGGLSLALSVFLRDMHSFGKNGTLNPGHLFGQICRKSTQFQGYEQQDAHELLRCLLDAIRNEEIMRVKKAILRAFALSEKTDPNTVNPRLKKIIKGYGRQATHTIIDQIFGGQLISTVFCEECHWSSQVFEPFMDLSVPVNEEKGKPKKFSQIDDDCITDSYGISSVSVSKHQLKKQRKDRKIHRAKRSEKRRSKHKLSTITSSPNQGFPEEAEDERLSKRLTEKRRPEDVEEIQWVEERREEGQGQSARPKKHAEESSKFRQLVLARSASRREEASGNAEDSDTDDEEDKEGEHEDDLSFSLLQRHGNSGERTQAGSRQANAQTSVGQTACSNASNENKLDGEAADDEDEDEETEDEDDEDEDEDEDEDTETEGSAEENGGSDVASSKRRGSSTENSDADEEDNADSEMVRHSHARTNRQPSIVVVQSENEAYHSIDGNLTDSRYLLSNSREQLNYNSASDTSERYFTASDARGTYACDTDDFDVIGDRMDQMLHRSHKLGATNYSTTSGRGDSISISSGEMLDPDQRVLVDPAHMDELCHKVTELKIRRKFSSKENLLMETQRLNFKRGSTETLHSFSNDRLSEEEESLRRKNQSIKKLKQEWISRSLTTLAPRYQCHTQECSVMSCLASFTAPELLTGSNKIICENCTKIFSQMHPDVENAEPVKSNASKQLLILSPPAVLTLHLKRFHHFGNNLTKVNRHVQFPLVLDLAPFTSSISQGLSNMTSGQHHVLYTLYGVVEHSGRLNSGHYVAYVRLCHQDPSWAKKHLLNLKPSSHFEINQLVTEMAEKLEEDNRNVRVDFQKGSGVVTPANTEEFEEEVRSGRWFHVSDTFVSEINIDRVLRAQAYLLFFERVI